MTAAPGRDRPGRPMKVLMVGQPRDTFRGRGAEFGSVSIVLRALADRLAERVDLHVVAPATEGITGTAASAAGYPVHHVQARGRSLYKALDLAQGLTAFGLPVFARDIYYRGYARAVADVAAALRPDIVHIQSHPQLAMPVRSAVPEARLVLHLHDEALARLPAASVRRRLRPFAAVVTCSQWVAEKLRRSQPDFAGPIEPVGNGIDTALFSRRRLRPEKKAKLLFVGRVSPEKGPHILIDAFVRLADRWPELQLVLAGPVGLMPHSFIRLVADDPPMASALPFYGRGIVDRLRRQVLHARTDLARELQQAVPDALRSRVHWLGALPHDRIVELMGTRTILVQPSLWREAFGLPLAEAMATGVAVVASRRGGHEELVDHEQNGVLVEAGDTEALVEAIDGLLHDPGAARALGDRAAEDMARNVRWRIAADRLFAVWDRLVPTRAASPVRAPAPTRPDN
ncbi:MAG: glycosyltransferase family 4 protein [Geminicoccaceae bacterium]|nr:glycosyltransferase family 4 protein [Geminicoccaceae bacterium]